MALGCTFTVLLSNCNFCVLVWSDTTIDDDGVIPVGKRTGICKLAREISTNDACNKCTYNNTSPIETVLAVGLVNKEVELRAKVRVGGMTVTDVEPLATRSLVFPAFT